MFIYLLSLIEILVVLVPILLSIAFVTVVERKVIGAMQRRVGPNTVGYYGILQPFADALKLVLKETIVPNMSNRLMLFLSPIVALTFALLGWVVMPLGQGLALADLSLGILFSMALSSVGILGILFAGWSSNSKFAFLGGLRSTSQIISYELILTSVILIVVLMTGTFSYTKVVEVQQSVWFVVPLLPLFIIWFISALAELNRTPFDLPEAESELVSGFNTDFSAMIFVFFFLAEYSNLILISTLTTVFFFGGFHFPAVFSNYTFLNIQSIILALKICFFCFLFVFVRASLPRLRFDQLITSCWLVLLPLVIGLIIFIPCLMIAFDCISVTYLFSLAF